MLAGRRAWGAAVRLAGFAGGLIAFIAGAIAIMAALATHNARPSPLDGNLSVIVLPFSAGEEEQPAATALAHTVATTLQAQLPQIDPLVLPSVHWYPTVPPQGLAAQGHIAAALASSERADAVMFGDVAEGELATITPYVYISAHRLRQASELAGIYQLGPPIHLPVQIGESTAADGLTRVQLAARARGLAEFVDALGYYAIGRYAQALAHLHAASASPSWATPTAQAMIDLFLGNATGKLATTRAQLATAGRYYSAALVQNPTLERARFGLAEVGFQLAHGDCTAPTIKRRSIARALTDYRTVLAASSPPPWSTPGIELKAKARFGVARVYLCLSQAGPVAAWKLAERELRLVIDAYAHAHFLRSEAGEAWGDLALAQMPASGKHPTRTAYLNAQQSYRHALELTLDPTGRAALYANLAFVEHQLGERAAAARDYMRAAHAEGNPSLKGEWLRLSRQS